MDKQRRSTYMGIIRRRFPNLLSHNIQFFPGGSDHDVFVVKEEFTFRFPKEGAATNPNRAHFLNQLAQRSPIAFPQISICHDQATGISYELNTFIPGVPFVPPLAATFRKEKLLRIAQQLGDFLTVLHASPIAEARLLNMDEMDPTQFWAYMAHDPNAYPHYREITFPYLARQEQEWIQELFENYSTLIRATPFPTCVSHNDLWTHHIIVDPIQRILSGVIDFDLRIADPACDFKAFEHYGSDFVSEAYRHYHLPIDAHFDQRRLFYTGHDLLFELVRAVESGNAREIRAHKKALCDYIAAHPVTQ